ncbi:MAG TPA: hypothetical protein VGG75_16030 [Trebonia sp.]|jgi:hypothetical protein
MTAQVTDTAASPAARSPNEDQAAALAMLRRDAVDYVTKLFDWIEEAAPGSTRALVQACFDATEKPFHEVLTGLIASAQEGDDFYLYMCTERMDCQCHHCRYPAEPEEDPRAPWTALMDNVRDQ